MRLKRWNSVGLLQAVHAPLRMFCGRASASAPRHCRSPPQSKCEAVGSSVMAFVFAEGIRLAHKVGALAAEKKTSRFPGRNRKVAGRFPEADEPFVTKGSLVWLQILSKTSLFRRSSSEGWFLISSFVEAWTIAEAIEKVRLAGQLTHQTCGLLASYLQRKLTP